MFRTEFAFHFTKINSRKVEFDNVKYIEYVYAFRGKGDKPKRYIVFIEEYEYFVFAVKFCLQERKNHHDRFNVLSNSNECSRVLTTVGLIMMDILKRNPFASFGFLGSNLKNEGLENTKRFRLYSKIIGGVISPLLFTHHVSLKHSAYLMINRDNQELDLREKVEAMFMQMYNYTF